MAETLRLMCILAHPDDESQGTGGILAKYAAEGVETYLLTATRGERGWQGDPKDNPGLEALGQLREQELRAAAEVLGICEVSLLDYIDGDLDQANPAEAVAKIVAHVRRVRPQVVVTFGPDGAYGHPDHIAICQFTTAALVCAADTGYDGSGTPHRVSKLYYMAGTQELFNLYSSVFGEIVMTFDGVPRTDVVWPDWAITARVASHDYWKTVLSANTCHRSQLPNFEKLMAMPEDFHRRLWGLQTYYRAYSVVNGGRAVENDLFEGLR